MLFRNQENSVKATKGYHVILITLENKTSLIVQSVGKNAGLRAVMGKLQIGITS